MSDELQATCGFCGKQFEPHSGSYWETGFTAEEVPLDDEISDIPEFTPLDIAIASDQSLSEIGLDRETADQLLKLAPGEVLDTGAMAVCDECAAKNPEDLQLE